MLTLSLTISLLLTGAATVGAELQGDKDDTKFSDIISTISEKRDIISEHRFFKMLADPSLPYERRMSFIPYWSYFAMSFADILDSWLYIENPKNELEERVNTFVGEDDFHYNLFLHDVEVVLGYTQERFSSYSAVLRHTWSDETKAVRQLMYTWIACTRKYDDPLITLASFETIEAGLKDIFEVTFSSIYMPEDGLKDLKYFGLTHVELEVNHTQTAWFREGDSPFRPLGELDVSPLQWKQAMEMVDEIFDRYGQYNNEFIHASIFSAKG